VAKNRVNGVDKSKRLLSTRFRIVLPELFKQDQGVQKPSSSGMMPAFRAV